MILALTKEPPLIIPINKKNGTWTSGSYQDLQYTRRYRWINKQIFTTVPLQGDSPVLQPRMVVVDLMVQETAASDQQFTIWAEKHPDVFSPTAALFISILECDSFFNWISIQNSSQRQAVFSITPIDSRIFCSKEKTWSYSSQETAIGNMGSWHPPSIHGEKLQQ